MLYDQFDFIYDKYWIWRKFLKNVIAYKVNNNERSAWK